MEKIISVKSGEVVEKEGKEWIEIVDNEDKKHRIFPSMMGSDGVWVHLDKEIDMLKGKIEDGTINGLSLKLTKEKKGQYWNVIGVELISDVFVKEAIEKVQSQQSDHRDRLMCLSYSKDLAVAGVIDRENITKWAEAFYYYVVDEVVETITIEYIQGVKRETKTSKEPGQDKQDEDSGTDSVSGKETIAESGKPDKLEDPTSIQELLYWVKSHDIKNPSTWLCETLGVSSPAEITNIDKAYKDIKELAGW